MGPLVSCLMPTRARHALLPAAVANFLAQDFADAELLIFSEDGVPDSLASALSSGRVHHLPCPGGLSLGAKRNFACQAADGEFLAHWDDDDWYAPDRLRRQIEALLERPGKGVCGSSRVYFRELDGSGAWEYRYQGERRPWLCGATLLFRRAFWQAHPFPDQSIGEDNHFVWSAQTAEAFDLDDPALCIASVHAGNTSRKQTDNAWWTPVPRERVEARIRAAGEAPGDSRRVGRQGAISDSARPRAVLALAGGIGDVLRWAALVPVLDAAGYAVDLAIAADYPDIAGLFDGAAGVSRLLPPGAQAGARAGVVLPAGGESVAGTRPFSAEPPPELAVLAYWATAGAGRPPAHLHAPLHAHPPARRQIGADRERWRQGGDPACIAAIARDLGWHGPLPLPPLAPALYAVDASVAPGTLAIHAGCKAGWPWKKWHGFGELAQHFARVLRVGSAADDDARGTYFGEPIRWPDHVRDATAPRPLAATARLLAGCSALVANDSGLMHLAAALGVPTLGIFGITSPAREAMPWPALRTISGGLDCEAACREQPWGRSDCARHLACLKTLDVGSVARRLRQIAPALAAAPAAHLVLSAVPSAAPSNLPSAANAAAAITADASRAPVSKPSPQAVSVPAQLPLRPPVPMPCPAPLPIALRLSGGFGDLLIAGPVIEALWRLAGFGPISCYGERPELAAQALGGRGLIAATRPLRDWPAAAGMRLEINQFVRFFDAPERWQASHPALAALISRAAPRLASVRQLVERHPQLDGLWARINLAAGRQRGDALAWTAGLGAASPEPPAARSGEPPELPELAELAARCTHASPLTLALDEADLGPRLALAADGRRWLSVHDGFDGSARIAPGGAVKCWPLAHWEELVRRLRAAHPELRIVQIGGASSRAIAGVDNSFVGRASLGEALWLLAGAVLHIDGESGLVHAARAFGTPSVVLFGPTDARFFGHAGNSNIDAGVCAPCWWSTPDWMSRCPRGLAQPACMTAITPARVLAAVQAQLARREAAATDAAPPLCVDGSAVWTAPGAGGDSRIAAIKAFAALSDGSDGHARSTLSGCHLHATKHWEYAAALDALGLSLPTGKIASEGSAGEAPVPLRIADLGCGRSPLGPWLAAQGHTVSGFDRDFAWDGNGAAAQTFLGWACGSGFVPRPATLYALPAGGDDSADAFDAVLMLSVLQHLAQPALALREAIRILRPGGRLILSFDLACEPARFEDGRLRRSIPSPARLAAWLGLAEASLAFDAAAIKRSAAAVQAAGVAGMPGGLTVGVLSLLKGKPSDAPAECIKSGIRDEHAAQAAARRTADSAGD